MFKQTLRGTWSQSNNFCLTLSRRRPLSYRNQSIDLLRKSMDWFLYDNGLRLERVKMILSRHKTKWHQLKLPKGYIKATISILCMFIHVYDVIYLEIQFNYSKLCNLNLPAPPGRREKINLNFYFHTSLWCLERFSEGLKDLHEAFWGTTKKCEI